MKIKKVNETSKINAFLKEYVTGRKGQFDLDIRRSGNPLNRKRREALITQMEEKFYSDISHIAADMANTLKQEMDLL